MSLSVDHFFEPQTKYHIHLVWWPTPITSTRTPNNGRASKSHYTLSKDPTHRHKSASSFTSIPVLDFSQAISDKPVFLEALREALVNVGFFYLRNAPIPREIQEEFTERALELFDLPLEKRLEIEMVNSPHFLGYSRLCAEITALKLDHREQFDVSAHPASVSQTH